MSTVHVTNQKEWDALPEWFDAFTTIEIRSSERINILSNPANSSARLWDNSSAVLWGNSSARLWDNSSAVLWDNSSAKLYNNSSAKLYNNSSARLWDNSSAVLWDNSSAVLWDNSSARLYLTSICYNYSCDTKIQAFDNSTTYLYSKPLQLEAEESVNIIDKFIKPTFDQWIDRGVVCADGIYRKLISTKVLGNKIAYMTDKGFVARQGDKFSHGETLKQAVDDLIYKISDRDKSYYNNHTLETTMSKEAAIEMYRVITGACSFGVKEFVESRDVKDELSVKEIIDITKDKFGHETFKEFFGELE